MHARRSVGRSVGQRMSAMMIMTIVHPHPFSPSTARSWDDAIGSTVKALGFHGMIGLFVLARTEVRCGHIYIYGHPHMHARSRAHAFNNAHTNPSTPFLDINATRSPPSTTAAYT